LFENSLIKNIQKQDNSETIFYFYWGVGTIYIIPFIETNCRKIVSRFHGYDWHEEKTIGYLPLRRAIFKKLTHCAFVSENAKKYTENRYGDIVSSKSYVHELGVFSHGRSVQSNDNVLRIVTCSFMVPVKRIPLLIDALKEISIPIEWTHIGEGIMRQELEEMTQLMPANIKVTFAGYVDSVFDFYVNNPVDLFIHVS
jgi:glycosyltransferase involved in cell wall biosynthesis